ncbi:MAG: LysR family transcriptional regulator [Microbacterium sp.]
MELDDFTAFLAVVEHGGFRRAAGALYVSQPSLSRRVSRLEQEIGATLLHRTARGVRLTSQGEILASGARRLISTLDEVRAATSGNWSNTIVIACTAIATGRYLSDFLAEWIPRHPETRVRIVEDVPAAVRRRLAEDTCDLALIAPPVERRFASLPIARAQINALLPPAHRLSADTGPLRIDDLRDEPLLINGDQYLSGRMLAAAAALAGVPLQVIFECTAGDTLAALVNAGIGIAVVSDAVYDRRFPLPARALMDMSGVRIGFDLRIVWSRERRLNPLAYLFAEEFSVFAQAREQPPTASAPV